MTENSGAKQAGRFEKGRSGNPAGKPPGARHRATLAAEMLLDGEAQALTRKAIERALAGDVTALRLCLERIVPVRKERPLRLALPSLTNAGDAARAIAAITGAVAAGEVTPGEAADLSALVSSFAKTLETSELEVRIAALESRRKAQ
jgi:Family of unknown function (DUF5681)